MNGTVPADFVCPITQQLMADPVIDRQGVSYERAAVEQWLQQHNTSPVTRAPLQQGDLVPNLALRNSIELFLSGGGPLLVTAPQITNSNNNSTATTTTPLLTVTAIQSGDEILVSICPPEGPPTGTRAAMDVVLVLDVSGSMGDSATVQDGKGNNESHGLSILDVVAHASNTVAHMLNESDRLAIVTFSSSSTTPQQLISMTADGKTKTTACLKKLRPTDNTNLWAGLHTGMEVLSKRTDTSRIGTVLLLTDGCPNVEPPRGHIPSLKKYLDELQQCGALPFNVNAFGFGYNLDSPLLSAIAQECDGMYVFIPDSGLVGTVFVNVVANLLSTMCTGVTVSIESSDCVMEEHPLQVKPTSYGAAGKVGSVQYGQTRDFFFKVDSKTIKTKPTVGSTSITSVDGKETEIPLVEMFVNVSYNQPGSTTTHSCVANVMRAPLSIEHLRKFEDHKARNLFNHALSNVADKSSIAALATALNTLHPTKGTLVEALVKDAEGQVQMALNPEFFNRWGRHYLPSLLRANIVQQCNNFKDFSVQKYGGKLFATLRDSGEKVFLSLPPAKPSSPLRQQDGGQGAPTKPTNMRQYYNCSGGCVLPSCRVLLADGSTVVASMVHKGDTLSTGGVVRCVVAITVPDGTPMVELKTGLCITEYHPVRLAGGGCWTFPTNLPADVVQRRFTTVGAGLVFTYVLEGAVSLCIEGVEVIALGHGVKSDAVASHEYLGTLAVVRDLSLLDGFVEGLVTVGQFQRHAVSCRINGVVSQVVAISVQA